MSRAPEGSGALVARNTMANAAGRLLNVGLAVAITPLLLSRLGRAEYGIWLLSTGLTFAGGYLSIAELGFMQVVVRSIAQARATRDFVRASEIASSSMLVYAALGTVISVALVFVADPLASAFAIPDRLHDIARLVFVVVGVQIAFDLPSASIMAVLEGSQRYGALRFIEAFTRIGWFAGSSVAVLRGHGVVALAVVALCTSTLTVVLSFVVARVFEPDVRLSLRYVHVSALRGLVRDVPPMFALRVLSIAYSQMDRVIIGVVLGAAAVADYEVAFKIHSVAALVLGVAPSAVMPAAAYLTAGDEKARTRSLYLRGTKYTTAAGFFVSVAAVLFARPLISAWVGPEFARLEHATQLFLVYPAIAATLVIGQTILIGRNEMKEVVGLHGLAVVVNLVLSITLAARFGIVGVVLGTLLGNVVLWPPAQRLFFRRFDVAVGEWLLGVVAPVVPALLAQVTVGAALAHMAHGRSLPIVGVLFGLDLVVAGAIFLLTLPTVERRALVNTAVRRHRVPEPE